MEKGESASRDVDGLMSANIMGSRQRKRALEIGKNTSDITVDVWAWSAWIKPPEKGGGWPKAPGIDPDRVMFNTQGPCVVAVMLKIFLFARETIEPHVGHSLISPIRLSFLKRVDERTVVLVDTAG